MKRVRLTDHQYNWLIDLVAGRDPEKAVPKTQAHYAGRQAVVASLTRRGYIDVEGKITEAGRSVVPPVASQWFGKSQSTIVPE